MAIWGARHRVDRFRSSTQMLARIALALVATCGSGVGAGAVAEKAPQGGTARNSVPVASKPLVELQTTGSLAAQYCAAARDSIAEARYAQQTAQLERLAKQADERLAAIEKKSAELKEWIAKRDSFIATATQHLVAIYSAMRPESASEQLVRLDVFTAAAILSGLEVRAASAIMNDMPAEKAARLTAVIASSARKESQDKQ